MQQPRKDIDFSINFTVPPEAITAYFDGQAKVEAAKRGPTSGSSDSGFNWMSLASILPMVLPFLLSSGSSASSQSKPKRESKASLVDILKTLNKHSEVREEVSKPSEVMEADLEVVLEKVVDEVNPENKTESKPKEDPIPSAEPVKNDDDEFPIPVTVCGVDVKTGKEAGEVFGQFTDMIKKFAPMVQEMTTAFGGSSVATPKVESEGKTDEPDLGAALQKMASMIGGAPSSSDSKDDSDSELDAVLDAIKQKPAETKRYPPVDEE